MNAFPLRWIYEPERFEKTTVQREFRIKELRDEVESLKAKRDDIKNTEHEI